MSAVKSKLNIMIDLETLDTAPSAAILSIAAVPFSDSSVQESPCYLKVDPTTCAESGLTVSDETLDWWSRQSREACQEAFSGQLHIRTALIDLADWITQLHCTPIIWAKGANFDPVILTWAYNVFDLEVPWKYSDVRCYRTLTALWPNIPFVPPTVSHNALHDAQAQAAHASKILGFSK